jgi:hypothetical protein
MTNTKETVLSWFWENDLHDTPITKMSFDFEKQEIEIHFLLFEKTINDYKPLIIIFKGIVLFEINYPQTFDFVVKGCFSLEVKESEKAYYVAEFVLELEDKRHKYPTTAAVCEIKIGFVDFQILNQ